MPGSTLPGYVVSGTEYQQWLVFIVAHATGVLSLGCLLGLIWWTGVKRPTVVITMVLAFMLNSICNLMCIDTIHGPVPTSLALVGYVFSLCGTTVIACTSFSTTVFVWATLQRSFGRRVPFSKHFDLILLVFPWVMYFADMIFTFAWYPGHKEELHTALLGGYSVGLPTHISHFIVAAVIVCSLVVDIWATLLVVKNRRIARQTSIIGASETSQLNYPFITRVLMFGLANLGGLVTAVMCYSLPDAHAPAIYQACCAFGLFLMFGTQADLYIATGRKLWPSSATPDPSSVPPTPRNRGAPAFPSHIGRLSTFWVSVTTHGHVRQPSHNSDLESLQQVPDLLRDGGGAHSRGVISHGDGSAGGEGDDDDSASKAGGRPSVDSSALVSPKPQGDWNEKDDRFVVVASGSDAGRSTATTDDKAAKDQL